MKNTTRREFLGKSVLQMNLVVKVGFGGGACGKRGARDISGIQNQSFQQGKDTGTKFRDTKAAWNSPLPRSP